MLGPSEGGLGGQDAPDGFPASGRNAYPPGANTVFADAGLGFDTICRVYKCVHVIHNSYSFQVLVY